LKTNLQPMNEFKASLDHIFKMFNQLIEAGHAGADKMKLVREEYQRIRSHLCRAFFDIADACSIDIRQQIIDDLSIYSNEVINLVLPEYYSVWRPEIEKLSQKIGSYRQKKGGVGIAEEIDLFSEYHSAISRLTEIMNKITDKACSLKEAQDHMNKHEHQSRKINAKIAILVALGSVISTAIITYFMTIQSVK
jgi:hypothetical protein